MTRLRVLVAGLAMLMAFNFFGGCFPDGGDSCRAQAAPAGDDDVVC